MKPVLPMFSWGIAISMEITLKRTRRTQKRNHDRRIAPSLRHNSAGQINTAVAAYCKALRRAF